MPAAAKATGQYLNSQLAKLEALKHGFDEAILLNEVGNVADGTGENVFLVIAAASSRRRRRPRACPASRARPSSHRRELGYEVLERDVTRTDLYFADEVFLTGTAAEVTPVASVDDHQIGPGPVTAIQSFFFDVVHGRSPLSAEYLEFPAGDRASTP